MIGPFLMNLLDICTIENENVTVKKHLPKFLMVYIGIKKLSQKDSKRWLVERYKQVSETMKLMLEEDPIQFLDTSIEFHQDLLKILVHCKA